MLLIALAACHPYPTCSGKLTREGFVDELAYARCQVEARCDGSTRDLDACWQARREELYVQLPWYDDCGAAFDACAASDCLADEKISAAGACDVEPACDLAGAFEGGACSSW